jgi:hypothetical protein
MYLTPARFRISGFGIDTSSLSDAELRSHLVRASAAVDSFCNLPKTITQTDFRGGRVVAEQHRWRRIETLESKPGDRRVYLVRHPVRDVEEFKIVFTNTYYISLSPSNLYVNRRDGFVEIIASQPTIVGFPPVGYWLGLAEPIIEVTYTYGWRYEITSDRCLPGGGSTYFATHGMWDSTASVTVYVNGTAVAPSTYTVDYEDGTITFASPPTGIVTADYTATLPQAIPEATGYIAVDSIAHARQAARGLIGLTAMRVEEVEFRMLRPQDYVTQNGVTIPVAAAQLLGPFVRGS